MGFAMSEVECPRRGKRHSGYDATAGIVARCGQYRDIVILPAETILVAATHCQLDLGLT
jgi:hypothetical protein